MINVSALINYGRDAVGGGYCYGSSGEVCSLARRKEWATWNPSQATNLLGICAKWDGMKVWDCSGLFRGAWRTLDKSRSGGATTIWKTWCTGIKGTIDTMPNIPGIAVFRQDGTSMAHIGLYVGDGMVVDARGSAQGVLYGTLASYGKWSHWALLDDVDYKDTQPKPEEPTVLWTGYVKTKTGGGISLWKDNTKKQAVVKLSEGTPVDVLGKPDAKGFASARAMGMLGVADLQYIVPNDGEEPSDTEDEVTVVVPGVSQAAAKELMAKYPGAYIATQVEGASV